MGYSGQRRLRNSGRSNENFRVIVPDFVFIIEIQINSVGGAGKS
jgi:hypothetical protein